MHSVFGWINNLVCSYGYFGIFVVLIIFNIVPFVMPPNWIVAALFGTLFPDLNPILLGFSTAAGTSIGRMEVYLIGRGSPKLMSEARREKLMRIGRMLGMKGAFAAFVFAATPLPDDALIITLGMMRYKFQDLFVGYFFGKFLTHTLAIYFFKISARSVGFILKQHMYGIIITTVVSILFTIAAVLIDWEKLFSKYAKLLPASSR